MPSWKRFAKMIRSYQPQTMMVARWDGTIYENYKTPEQEIPENTQPYPWETCMTMAGQWSYNANDIYKPTRQLIQMLAQVVSRGGNYLLNVGPGPDGELHPTAYERLKEIGAWMKINSEAIYGTQPVAPYKEAKKAFTQKGGNIYAIYLADENETKPPSEIKIESFRPAKGSKVHLLGYDKPLSWKPAGDGFVVSIPRALQQRPPCEYAWVVRFQQTHELSALERKEGFKMLFDGTNMDSWTGNTIDYRIIDGCIEVNASGTSVGNLYTKDEYADFVFRFEFQLTPAANNGVGIRAPMEGDNAYNAMEIQILDCENPEYNWIAPYQHHGSVYGVIPAAHGAMKPIGEWNEEEIYANGDNIRVTLNGVVILDGNIREASQHGTPDGKEHPGLLNKSGHIGFLGHGSPLKFRNIRVKTLK
jgi:hypothetical protein